MSKIEPKEKSIWRAQNFYEELERLLKRHKPEEFAPALSSLLAKASDNTSMWRYYPPHQIVHAVEANCAYYKSPRDMPVTENRINAIMNHYRGYYDPYIKFALTEKRSMELFAVAMARQQFALQRKPGLNDLARCLLLYVDDEPLPKTAIQFFERYGFSMRDWVYMCLATFTLVQNLRPPVVRPEMYTKSEVTSMPKHAVIPFLTLASQSPETVSARYSENRKSVPLYLHIFIPSIFFEYPIIAFPNSTYLVVHAATILQLASSGLYRLCYSIDASVFLDELGSSFERYVGRLLPEVGNTVKIWTEADIQGASKGPTCDYMVEFVDCLLLVECKATKYSARLLTENAIAGDNSTGKLATASDQILSTAKRLSTGALAKLVEVGTRPVFGVVVTYGEITFADSKWYFDSFVLPRMSTATADTPDWYSPLARPIQVLPADLFEAFLIVLRGSSGSLAGLINSKLDDPAGSDWAPFLFSLDSKVAEWELPILKETYRRFFGSIVGQQE